MQQLNFIRHIRLIAIALISAFILFLWGAIAPILPVVGQSKPDTFEQVWQTVNENFFDPNFNGINWRDIHEKYRPQANQAQSKADLARVIDDWIDRARSASLASYARSHYPLYNMFATL